MWLGWWQYDTTHLHSKGCPSGDNWQMTPWTTPTQNITLLLNIWLWTKFSISHWKGKFQTQHKRFGIKIYKLYDKTGYTYCMEVYLGKDRTWLTADMTTHATVNRFTKREWKDMGIRCTRTTSVPLLTYLTIWLNRKSTVVEQYKLRERECHMTWPNKLLKCGDSQSRTRDDLTAMVWADGCDVMCWQMCAIH
jgi:hypothetical protein